MRPTSTLLVAFNWVLLFAVAIPAVWFAVALRTTCTSDQRTQTFQWLSLTTSDVYRNPALWCAVGHQAPFVTTNILFFLNVCVLFWFLSLVQRSTWLIDPYWTIVPPMIGLFYKYHPNADFNDTRSLVSMFLLFIWSIRLTHSYFRREEWQLGAREDWRFSELKSKHAGNWWWMSFFATYVSQQAMLVGITAPLLAIHSSHAAWDPVWDTAIAALAAAGIMIATIADNQLRAFMLSNERRRATGQPPQLILDSGLWYYSRHPNYFGEQLWWWSLALWGVKLGWYWTVAGTLFNSICLVEVTRMTERRMAARPERAQAWEEHCARTSVWVPWFKVRAAPLAVPVKKAD